MNTDIVVTPPQMGGGFRMQPFIIASLARYSGETMNGPITRSRVSVMESVLTAPDLSVRPRKVRAAWFPKTFLMEESILMLGTRASFQCGFAIPSPFRPKSGA